MQDQFALILNQPAGRIATVVVKHTVDLIVGVRPGPPFAPFSVLMLTQLGFQAWYNNTQNPDRVIDQVSACTILP